MVISLLVKETEVPEEHHRPVATQWQALSHDVTSEDGILNVKNSTYHWSSVPNTRNSLPSHDGDYTTFDGLKENVILLEISNNSNTS